MKNLKIILIVLVQIALVWTISAQNNLNVSKIGETFTVWDSYPQPTRMSISGDMAYVCTGRSGLHLIDISEPSDPFLTGHCKTGYRAWDVDVEGEIACVAGYRGEIITVDVSDPENPVVLSILEVPNNCRGIDIVGNTVYAACEYTGLVIVDITDPVNPEEIAVVFERSFAEDVCVVEDFAYVLYDGGWISVINITNPEEPVQQTTVNIDYQGIAFEVEGNYLYSAHQELGISITDISDPADPVVISSLTTPGTAYDLALWNLDYLYVADDNSGVFIIDVSDPNIPLEVDSYDTPGIARGIDISDHFAFVHDVQNGFHVMDLSNPEDPSEEANLPLSPGDICSINKLGDLLVTGFKYGLISVADVSDPENPLELGSINLNYNIENIVIQDQIAYVASNIIHCIDLSDPENLTLLNSINVDNEGMSFKIAVEGQILYVVSRIGEITIINIEDLDNPVEIVNYQEFQGELSLSQVKIYNDHLFLVIRNYHGQTGVGLLIFDIQDMENPELVSQWSTTDRFDNGDAYDIEFSGDYAFISNAVTGVSVLDICNILHPVEVATVGRRIYSRALMKQGDFLSIAWNYVDTQNHGGLEIVNIQDPVHPVTVGQYSTDWVGEDIYLDEEIAYLGTSYGVEIFDCSDALDYEPPIHLNPPSLLSADHQGAGVVNLNWMAIPELRTGLHEDFEDNQAQDFTLLPEDNFTIEDGYLKAAGRADETDWCRAFNTLEAFDNIAMEVEFSGHSRMDFGRCALFLRCSSTTIGNFNGYELCIYPSINRVILDRWSGEDIDRLYNEDSEYLNCSFAASNTATVSFVGSTISLYINGQFQASIEDATPYNLGVFGVGGECEQNANEYWWDYISFSDDPDLLTRLNQGVDFDTERPLAYWETNNNEMDEFLEYNIYRDGILIASTDQTNYQDIIVDAPGFGAHEYTVTANYDEGESPATWPAMVEWLEPQNFAPVEPTGVFHNIEIEEVIIEGTTLAPGSEISVFDGDLCVGAEVVLEDWPLTLHAWGNNEMMMGFTPGNNMNFRVFSRNEHRQYPVQAMYLEGDDTFQNLGHSVVQLSINDNAEQIIPLQGMYIELISTYLEPENLDAEAVFGDIESLFIVYQNNGEIFVPPNFNNIDDINPQWGYKVFCLDNSQLTIQGEYLDVDMVYNFTSGQWHWLGYPVDYLVPVETALESIEEQIRIILNDSGEFWIPSYGVNTLGNLTPGEGYLIFFNEDVNFQYNLNGNLARPEYETLPEPGIQDVSVQSTGQPYVILVSLSEKLQAMDPAVIEIYDGDLLVGKSVISEDYKNIPLIAWQGAQEYNLAGFKPGNTAAIRVLSSDGSILATDQSVCLGSDAFADITLDIDNSAIPGSFAVNSAYPNPFNPRTLLSFAIPQTGKVKIAVYNLLGQQIFETCSLYSPGIHQFEFNTSSAGNDLVSGMYFIQVSYNENIHTQKVMLLK